MVTKYFLTAFLLFSSTVLCQPTNINWITGGYGTMAEFSPDSKYVVAHSSLPSQPSLIIWSASTGDRVATLFDHDNHLGWQPFAFSSDGEFIAVTDVDKIILRKERDFSIFDTLFGHLASVTALSFSMDNKMLASGGRDSTIIVWDIHEGHLLQKLRWHTQYVNSLLFSSDNDFLISSSDDGTNVWDLLNRKLIHSYPESKATLVPIQSAEGAQAIVLAEYVSKFRFGMKALKIVGLKTGRILRIFSFEGRKEIENYLITRSGRYIVTYGRYGLNLYDFLSGKLIRRFDNLPNAALPSVGSISISNDEHFVFAPADYSHFACWNLSTGKLVQLIPVTTSQAAFSLSVDGATLLSSSGDGVRLWAVGSGKLIRELSSHCQRVSAIAASSDSKYIVSGGFDGKVELFDQSTGKKQWSFPVGKLKMMTANFSADNKYVATVGEQEHYVVPGEGYDGSGVDEIDASIWETNSGKIVKKLSIPPEPVSISFLTMDGKYLCYSLIEKPFVRLWDVKEDTLFKEYTFGIDGVRAIEYTDDRKLTATSNHTDIQLWDMATNKLLWQVKSAGFVRTMAFLDSGKKLLTLGQDDHQIRIWDAHDGRLLQTIETVKVEGPHSFSWMGVVSPKSNYFAYSGRNYIQVIDVSAGKVNAVYYDYPDLQNVLAWSPDERFIFSGSFDGSIISWINQTKKRF